MLQIVALSLDKTRWAVSHDLFPSLLPVSTALCLTWELSSCWPSRAETSRWSLLWWTTETSPSTPSKTSSCPPMCTPKTSLLFNITAPTRVQDSQMNLITNPWCYRNSEKVLLCVWPVIYNGRVVLVPKFQSVSQSWKLNSTQLWGTGDKKNGFLIFRLCLNFLCSSFSQKCIFNSHFWDQQTIRVIFS